jgi:hypothetical protein
MNIQAILGTENITTCADNSDEQTVELMCNIIDYFQLKFSPDEKAAWNQLNNCIKSVRQKDLIRNQIFKTAILLKLPVPSYSF